jgi:hypothetical protein
MVKVENVEAHPPDPETVHDPGVTIQVLHRDDGVARAARTLRALYFFRVGFSIAWVILVASLASSGRADGRASALAGSLLVIYPISDAVATVFDIRGNRGASIVAQYVNLAVSLAAALGVLIAVLSSVATAIGVFGVWAIVSGAIMVVVAALRRRSLGGQWPMIISGAGSVFAGFTFIGWTGSAETGLAALAQYSAGGAIWYLLTAFWLFGSTRGTVHASAEAV